MRFSHLHGTLLACIMPRIVNKDEILIFQSFFLLLLPLYVAYIPLCVLHFRSDVLIALRRFCVRGIFLIPSYERLENCGEYHTLAYKECMGWVVYLVIDSVNY